MKLYVVRHGQSENNLKKLFTGWTDAALTEKGIQDALGVREFLGRRTNSISKVWFPVALEK